MAAPSSNLERVGLIVPAAGSGERLGASAPKALVPVAGRPLVARTLAALLDHGGCGIVEIIVLVPPSSVAEFSDVLFVEQQSNRDGGRREEARQKQADWEGRVIEGGATRQQSVALGLNALSSEPTLIMVHDAARPFVTAEAARGVVAAASKSGAATLASRPPDSIRADSQQSEGRGETFPHDRRHYWLVGTPQVFRFDLLASAHREAQSRGLQVTDDASLIQDVHGLCPTIVESMSFNLKITTPDDLRFAEAWFSTRS